MKFSFEKLDFIEKDVDPLKIALIGENETLSWLEFQSKVDETVSFLKENKLDNPSYPFIIYGHKEVAFIVSVYACIKLSIPYIPIDVFYPNERLIAIKQISKSEVIINCSNQDLALEGGIEINFNPSEISIGKRNLLTERKEISQNPLVYIIFTSGSTGEPKGVQITLDAIQTFTDWMTHDFGFSTNDVFVNIANFSFDLSVFELMTFAGIGGTLLLNQKSTTEDLDILQERIKAKKGTVLVSTPSFSLNLSRIEDSVIVDTLKYFLFCGEMLPNLLAKKLLENYPKTKVINTYGPTEATVATTLIEITKEIVDIYDPLPIGKPKRDSEIRIENDEIIIVGNNVSIGYLNRLDLNIEKFTTVNDVRAFKTGDLGYFKDGFLFCKGRNDDQVKLHGFRIELNEITSKINQIDYVVNSETIALRRNGEVKKIVSIVELKSSFPEDYKKDIAEKLSHIIPYYMIPSDFKKIDIMPLNQNGKTDKKALENFYLSR